MRQIIGERLAPGKTIRENQSSRVLLLYRDDGAEHQSSEQLKERVSSFEFPFNYGMPEKQVPTVGRNPSKETAKNKACCHHQGELLIGGLAANLNG